MIKDLLCWIEGLFKKNQTKSFPKDYYVGQIYVEDPIKIPCRINIYFRALAVYKNCDIPYEKGTLKLQRRGSILEISFEQLLSQKLVTRIRKGRGGDEWIFNYINIVLPYVNKEILKQRYELIHFLARTYSMLDIFKVEVVQGNKHINVCLPRPINKFIPFEELSDEKIPIHFKDLVDSIHSYFTSSFDEAMRQSITSLENSFDYYNISQIKQDGSREKFEKIVESNITNSCPAYKEKLSDIIISSYKIRNHIVHEGYTISPDDRGVCKKAIHAINDFYKEHGNDEKLKKYAFWLEGQFLLVEEYLGDGFGLDWLENNKPLLRQ